jgi:hypothetical protein
MENDILSEPFKENIPEPTSDADLNTEYLNEHVRKFIEELTRGATPQEAARHSECFKNTKFNYSLEKARHQNHWK